MTAPEFEYHLAPNGEPLPPWRAYPRSETFWGGWRQGTSEHWLHTVFLPFWQILTPEQRLDYLDRWQAPEDWREHVLKWCD